MWGVKNQKMASQLKVRVYEEFKVIPKQYHIKGTTGLVNLTRSAENYLKAKFPCYYEHQYLPGRALEAQRWDDTFHQDRLQED